MRTSKSFSEIIAKINDMPYDPNLEANLKKITERVAWLCNYRPAVKGNYSLLTFYYWRIFGGIRINADTFERIVNSPSPETIGRCFRKLSEKSKGTEYESQFKPTDEKVIKRRNRKFDFRKLMNDAEFENEFQKQIKLYYKLYYQKYRDEI